MLCPKCKRLMRPQASQHRWVCTACGTTLKMGTGAAVVQSTPKEKSLTVIEDRPATLPIAREECPACHNPEAFWVLRQTRGADEPETRIFECTKCGHKWREYQ
jgi:DNA-directed RNA polymerase subunit M